jgi:hypothetical protein
MEDGATFSYTAFDLIDEAGAILGPGYGREVDYVTMLRGNFGVLQSSVVVRRAALTAVGLFSPLLRIQQDLDLFLRLARVGRGSFVPTTEVQYRLHGTNASRNYWAAVQELLLVLDHHQLIARARGDIVALDAITTGRRTVRSTYSYQAIDAVRDELRRGNLSSATRAFVHSLRLSPGTGVRSTAAFVRARSSALRW